MAPASWRLVVLGLAALASTTSAVSLASFIPRIDSLPSQCASVYNSQIDGCKAEDFGGGAQCSKACVQGLNKITEAVRTSCADVDVGETSIIGVFQNGLGLASLCPNTPVTTVTPGPSTTRTTTQAQTSTQVAASSTLQTTTETTSSASSQTQNAQSSSTTSGGINIDSSAPVINTASRPAANPTQAPNSQLSNADSGGGSPFDVVAIGSAAQVYSGEASLGALLMTAVVLVACA
ncbi:hypothetical protein ACN47E_002574 [Coniothyrium glycines]